MAPLIVYAHSLNFHHVSGHLCIIKSVPNSKSLTYYDLYEGYKTNHPNVDVGTVSLCLSWK